MASSELSPVAVIVLGYLMRGPQRLNAVQLSAKAGIPLAAVQVAVDELVSNGRVRMAAGGGLTLVQVDEVDLTVPVPLNRAQRDEQARQRWRTDNLLAGERTRGSDSVVAIHGLSATVGRIAASFLSGPDEVLALSPPPPVKTMQAIDAPARNANLAMLAAGTRSVWVLDESRLAAPLWRSHIDRLQRAGEEIYAAPDVSQRLIILDRTLAYLPLDPEDHARGAMLVDSPALVAGLVALFHEVLDRATPISGVRTVTQARRAILTMLAVGSKDEAIARKLDVSTRTVRRTVAAMMEECGAENRFQLAVAAVRLGWLTAEDLVRGPHPVPAAEEVGRD